MKGTLETTGTKIRHTIIDHKCDRCEKAFEPVFRGEDECIQPSDALEMLFIPYYGGYFDQGGPQAHYKDTLYRRFWLCEGCTEVLFTVFPSLRVKR